MVACCICCFLQCFDYFGYLKYPLLFEYVVVVVVVKDHSIIHCRQFLRVALLFGNVVVVVVVKDH